MVVGAGDLVEVDEVTGVAAGVGVVIGGGKCVGP